MLIICGIADKIINMKNRKNLAVGILAHVDAGKTTLSEAMLYRSGKIKKLGRVDHRDSFLDTHELERARGITIFSKQALLSLAGTDITLMDTPGHVDFAAETERTLQVLDYAVLVISGTDGVQAHTETLWALLERYNVPVFVFVTKMDVTACDREALQKQLCRVFGDGCVDFTHRDADFEEKLAVCSEEAMESFLENGALSEDDISELVAGRKLFPCFYGSGLKADGVDALLEALDTLTMQKTYPDEFAARVYKIGRDAQGNRMSFMKLTGGSLSVRQSVRYKDESGGEYEEKATAIRLYSGAKFENAETVCAGQVCAVLGLSATYPGEGLGAEKDGAPPVLEPVVSYTVLLPPDKDARVLYPKLMQLQEEDPRLHIVWNEKSKKISVRLMGKVQTEIFRSLVKERFDTDIRLDTGHVMYRETIKNTVEGVGHFEPLRHYSEVHLLMEPLPRGSGIVITSSCSEDVLDRNWQRLILTHLAEKTHIGVLTGSPITDIKITLVSGRAHLKHTEGGDFRQSTYRAVRQGLMQAESVLLEPWYAFSSEVPTGQTGRLISDVRAMGGEIDTPEDRDGMTRVTGRAPVASMNGYMDTLVAYTRGRGRLSLRPDGYRPCRSPQEIINEIGYDAASDTENTSDSVFCAHGAGFSVPWDKVKDYMHLESCLAEKKEPEFTAHRSISIDQKELEAIMEREFGPIRRPQYSAPVVNAAPDARLYIAQKKKYIIVDGYNLIFAWDEMKALAAEKLDLARARLMDVLTSYCGFTGSELVLVFDGFRTPGNPGSREERGNIRVVYTPEGETGDAYIERLVNDIGKNYSVRVITSDNLIRVSAMRSGVLRTSSGEFIKELEWVLSQIDELLKRTNSGAHKTKLTESNTKNGK